MELYNWQLCEYTCVRSGCVQILHQGIGDPRPRALFALAVLLSHRKILQPPWFPREGWWGRRHPCYKLVVANKFWVWRLNNKQHWFVAATCWAGTNVKTDRNEINRNTRSTMHQLQMAWFHIKWCQFHQDKRVSSSGSGDLVDTSEGSAALKSTHLCCSWQLSQVLVRLLLGDFINSYLKVAWHWKQKLGLFSSEKKTHCMP